MNFPVSHDAADAAAGERRWRVRDPADSAPGERRWRVADSAVVERRWRVRDAVVVGAGPNGLSAAVVLAGAGLDVLVLEAADAAGGACRSVELTLPGFVHDVGASILPLAYASPLFEELGLARHGLRWVHPEIPLAHPLEGGGAAALHRSLDRTAESLGRDGPAYRRLVGPLVDAWPQVRDEVLQPALHLPRHPLPLARFGARALVPASWLARAAFRSERARLLWAGIAAHATVPLSRPGTSAVGLVLAAAGHAGGWPFPQGGAGRLADALARELRDRGGEIELGRRVRSLEELPPARAVVLGTTPRQILRMAGRHLPALRRRRLGRYRYGPAAFKVDYALREPIPWTAPACRRAGTVHLSGDLDALVHGERAVARGRMPRLPFVLLAQHSRFDPTRAPEGRHTAWAYCHVPHGSTDDATAALEERIERFAPGFREIVLARRVRPPAALEAANPNLVGGDINGGANILSQLVARPVLSARHRVAARGLFLVRGRGVAWRMLAREVVPLPRHIYPPDEWRIVESRFDERHLDRAETIFALGNGFMGFRGTFEEGRPALWPGTFLNGFHETWPIEHAEEAYGLARVGQTIVNVPDATVLTLYIDDEPLHLPAARLIAYERVLDMRSGILSRELDWSTPSGKHVRVRSRRLVSFEHRHVAALTFEITVLDDSAPVTVVSKVINRQDTVPDDEPRPRPSDPRLAKSFGQRVLNSMARECRDRRFLLGYRTTNSGMTLGVGVDHVIETEMDHMIDVSAEEDFARLVVTADAEPGATIRITKYLTYQMSHGLPVRELLERCDRTLDRSVRDGFGTLVETQRENLDRFWNRADVQVDAADETPGLQQAIRWNLFQLAQATWRAEGVGVPAKGLTGQAYEGHYFWDTEIYVLPFLTYTQPRIARNLLRFRHSILDQARRRADELSQRGALFPWRTINGEEASAYYQAGTAQYHINADIAYALRRYVDIRDDQGFLAEVGAELLVETARMWQDLGFYGTSGHFHIHGVTGPDEYTTVVNDNTFTNLMARLNLNYAASSVRRIERERPDDFRALVHAVDLKPGEVEAWERAASAMFVPYDEQRGMNPQDSSFLERERWDLENTPRERFPLLLHYHPLVIYRHQVIKQADVVLAMFLVGNEFTLEEKRRNFEYYDPLTTGDSSLSACMQSIVAAEIGNEPKALEYFEYALMMDLADLAGNVSDGVHIASTGGVWQALVFGFGGVRDFDGDLTVDPRLPSAWRRLAFSLRFQDRQIRVRLAHEAETYLLEEGEPLDLEIRGRRHTLEPGVPLQIDRSPVPVAGAANPEAGPPA